ncbi:hypothetical protein N7527_010464 [Penicillium freii]|nr:hypothetical protein N7527_010464 [Penicillium freii]
MRFKKPKILSSQLSRTSILSPPISLSLKGSFMKLDVKSGQTSDVMKLSTFRKGLIHFKPPFLAIKSSAHQFPGYNFFHFEHVNFFKYLPQQ